MPEWMKSVSRSRTTYFAAKMEFGHIFIALAAQLKNRLDFSDRIIKWKHSVWLKVHAHQELLPLHFKCSMDPFLWCNFVVFLCIQFVLFFFCCKFTNAKTDTRIHKIGCVIVYLTFSTRFPLTNQRTHKSAIYNWPN